MKDFAAIDFETANKSHSSICSVGVVIVRGGKIVERIHRLIRPRPNRYIQWFTNVHGIRFADTRHKPPFPDVWTEIASHIEGLPLVAHNASFDRKCLREAHRAYGLECPEYKFYCTYWTSRRRFCKKKLPNYKLCTVAAHFGYKSGGFHNALFDATVCARIACKLADFLVAIK
jgi:DNA polymerase-3 subunit epsilon